MSFFVAEGPPPPDLSDVLDDGFIDNDSIETLHLTSKTLRDANKLEIGVIVTLHSLPPSILPTQEGIEHPNLELNFSTLLPPTSLAPLFSGSEWAGTRVWRASLEAVNRIIKAELLAEIRSRKASRSNNPKTKKPTPVNILELGAGLGVPGLCFGKLNELYVHSYNLHSDPTELNHDDLAGGHVVITDHPSILHQIKRNCATNFPSGSVIARPLDWSLPGLTQLMTDLPLGLESFDLVLSTDCVYEPLYGESYIPLSQCILKLLNDNEFAISVNVMERRRLDGIDKWLGLIEDGVGIGNVEVVKCYDEVEICQAKNGESWEAEGGERSGRIEVYVVYGKGWKRGREGEGVRE